MSTTSRQPRRITEVELCNFRGWIGQHTVQLDADLVLLAAPNGKGKSSLMEALARALGGSGVHADDTLLSIRPRPCGDGEARGDTPKQSPAATTGPGSGSTQRWHVTVRWNGGSPGTSDESTISGPGGRSARTLDAYEHPGVETVRRATFFTQDPLDDQFEKAGDRSDTVRGFFVLLPQWLNAYERELHSILGKLKRWKPHPIDNAVIKQATHQRDKAAIQLAKRIATLLKREPPPDTAPAIDALHQASRHLPDAPEWTTDGFNLETARALRRAVASHLRNTPVHQERIAHIRTLLHELEAEIRDWENRWPRKPSEQLARWSTGETENSLDLNRLLEVLTTLARASEHWIDPARIEDHLDRLPESSRAELPSMKELRTMIIDELKRVDAARAEQAHQVLQAWQKKWREVSDRYAELDKRRTKLLDEYNQTRSEPIHDEVLDAARLLERYQRDLEAQLNEQDEQRRLESRWPHIKARKDVLERHQKLLMELRDKYLTKDTRRTVQATMNAVMRHFVVAGTSPDDSDIIEVSAIDQHAFVPDFADGRKLHGHLSTGQKAQDALAWLLGTNALLQQWLPHHLLLLDDLSTALDLTNLAAECALLRKFAYARENHDRKRQVVLASHHDQLTHRIYDLLLPPDDFRMIEVRIVGWSWQDGPEVEVFEITPTRKADDQTRKELAEGLARLVDRESA